MLTKRENEFAERMISSKLPMSAVSVNTPCCLGVTVRMDIRMRHVMVVRNILFTETLGPQHTNTSSGRSEAETASGHRRPAQLINNNGLRCEHK